MTTMTKGETLTAGVEGVWTGTVCPEYGVSLSDLTDKNNEPASITHHSQTNGSAYRKAAKVWEAVKLAKSMNEASQILSAAGCKMHYYCRMD